MTNEEMCVHIQQGEKKYIPYLWNQVHKLMRMKSKQAYICYKERCLQCGVELADINQIAYFAFLKAIEVYKPESGHKLTSYIEYPFRTALYELIGLRTSRNKNDPLCNSKSLDAPIDVDDESSTTLIDTIADTTSLDFIEEMETASVGDTVRSVIETLSDPYRSVIQHYFICGLTLKQIAEVLNVSVQRVQQIKEKGIRSLKQNKILLALWRDYCDQRYRRSFSWFKTSPEYYAVLNAINKKPISYGYRQAELYEAQLAWEAQNNIIEKKGAILNKMF